MMKNIFLGITVAIFLLCGNAFAQTKQTDDEKAINAVLLNAGRAWQDGDINKLADTLTEDCVHIDPFGKQISGRDTIRTTLQWVRDVVYQKAKLELEVSETNIRFISSDVALVVMVMKQTTKGKSGGDSFTETFIVSKVKSKWKISLFQGIAVTQPPIVKPN
jgi:uncharacterized protein (TIGR02246 family)